MAYNEGKIFVRVFHPEVIPSQRFQETFDNIGIVTKTDADFIKTITSNDNPVIVLYNPSLLYLNW